MPNTIITPNMGIANPVPTIDPGPDWATNLYNAIVTLDAHNHSPGSGVQITPNGIDINSDLTFNNTNSAIDLKSVRFVAQSVPIPASSPNLLCLSVSGADLYYNDANGNQIRMTSGGAVAGSAGTITGLPSGTASAAFVAGSGTFVFQQATSTGANIDVASIAIRYPGSYPSPSGNYIQLQAPSSLATGYSITLPPTIAAAIGSFVTMDTVGALSYSTVDNSTLQLAGATLRIKPGGVTEDLLAPRTAANPAPLGGLAVALGSTSFSTTGTSPLQVTNQSITLTTSGRPVMLILSQSGVTPVGGISLSSVTSGTCIGHVSILRGITVLIDSAFSGPNTGVGVPPGSITYIDTPAAGTYTYNLTANVDALSISGTTLRVSQCALTAYEI